MLTAALWCALAGAWNIGPEPLPACDWITTGNDCGIFAAGDVDGDGFADLLTINGNRDLCVAPSVHGWKSGTWRVLSPDLDPGALGLAIVRIENSVRVVVVEPGRVVIVPVNDGKGGGKVVRQAAQGQTFIGLTAGATPLVRDNVGKCWKVSAENALAAVDAPAALGPPTFPALAGPPYDGDAKELLRFTSEFSAAGGQMAWAVFATDKPHGHRIVRNAVLGSPDPKDSDMDGLSDAEEAALGTDPHCRDTDSDGLLDGWEVHGLPQGRLSDRGPAIMLFDPKASAAEKAQRLDPRREDVIVNVSYFEQVDRSKFAAEIPKLQAVYRALHTNNPDGTTGVWVHVRELKESVPAADQKMAWWDVGAKYFARNERGLMHWMQVTPWGGGQSRETGDMGGCGNGWAVFAHEFGHQLSLSHTGDSAPGWCPLYPSLMNYAYSYSFDGDGAKPHFSTGEFRDVVLDEHHLGEKLPFAYERVKFLANRPFRFRLKDNGDGSTLIDWNHNGVFDEEEVVADINYGGSTQAGERKTHTLIGSAPSLAYIGGKCFLAAASHKQTAITVKMHKGEEQWTTESGAPSSASRADPVLIGGPEYGVLLVKRFDAWAVGTVRPGSAESDAPTVSGLTTLTDLGSGDVSGVRIGERVLLVVRHDDGMTEWRWLTMGEKPVLSEAQPLGLTSMVPPGMAAGPDEGQVTLVSSDRHPKHGPFTMQVSTLRVVGDQVLEGPVEWTHGGRPCHCTTRPVAVFPDHGGARQLTIFHTGWTDGNGTWTGWRTMRVENTELDDGWLTCQLYDEWTRSRVALGFADGPQGAFYAFRWDPGDHRDWKINTMFVAHGGYGIDDQPMRDFDDGARIGLWGIRHSILTMPTDAEMK